MGITEMGGWLNPHEILKTTAKFEPMGGTWWNNLHQVFPYAAPTCAHSAAVMVILRAHREVVQA